MRIPMVACMACATEISKSEIEDVSANLSILDEHLEIHGLKRIEVPPDGHCIIHSWRMGLAEACAKISMKQEDLLHLGVTEITNNLPFYSEFLPDEDLSFQLEAYALLYNYHSAVVDLMVHALANATCTTCIVLSAKCGEVRTTKIDPREGVQSNCTIRVCKVGHHYDAVLAESTTPDVSGMHYYTLKNE